MTDTICTVVMGEQRGVINLTAPITYEEFVVRQSEEWRDNNSQKERERKYANKVRRHYAKLGRAIRFFMKMYYCRRGWIHGRQN